MALGPAQMNKMLFSLYTNCSQVEGGLCQSTRVGWGGGGGGGQGDASLYTNMGIRSSHLIGGKGIVTSKRIRC